MPSTSQLPLNLNRQEHAGICATRSHRIDDRAGGKDCSLAGLEVGGGHAKRDAQIFKVCTFKVRASETRSCGRWRRSRSARCVQRAKVVKRTLWASSSSSADGESAAIRGAHDRAYTGARNHANWNAFFFEDFENADVRDAAGKASAQGDSDCRRWLRRVSADSARYAG